MNKLVNDISTLRKYIAQHKTTVLVGGSFYLLHVGHLRLLEYSKQLENVLIVCVLSDQYIRSYKPNNRPIIGEVYRAQMVASLQCVDYVFISDIDTSHGSILSYLCPDSVVFGIEDTQYCVQNAKIRENSIRTVFPKIKIHYLKRHPDVNVSTTGLIDKILATQCKL